MKSLLERVSKLDNLLRQLHKIESKMHAGQFIAAWRELRGVIKMLEDSRKDLIESDGEKETKDAE